MPVATSIAVGGKELPKASTGPSTAGPLDRLRRMASANTDDTQQPNGHAISPAEAPDQVIRRILPRGRKQYNRYEEVDEELTKITKKKYDAMVEDDEEAAVTEESGYVAFELERGEKKSDWNIDDKVMAWQGNVLWAVREFQLPISCIESAEHIVWQSGEDDAQDWSEDLADDKSVDVFMGPKGKKRGKSVLAANLGKDDLTKKLPKFGSLNFDIYPLGIGEGIVAIHPDEPETSLHAVAVVAVSNSTGQFIVVERNAGKTSGSTTTLDNKWLLNVYSTPADFRDSMGPGYIVGKLKR